MCKMCICRDFRYIYESLQKKNAKDARDCVVPQRQKCVHSCANVITERNRKLCGVNLKCK